MNWKNKFISKSPVHQNGDPPKPGSFSDVRSGSYGVKPNVKTKASMKPLVDPEKKPITKEELDREDFEFSQKAKDRNTGGVASGVGGMVENDPKAAEFAASFTPGVGEAIDAKDFLVDMKDGNYGGAALSAAGLALPFVPGKAVKKFFGYGGDAVKKVSKSIDKAFYPPSKTVYRQAPADANVMRTSYKGSESASAKKVREKGDFYTDKYEDSEFYGRGDIDSRGIRQGDDVVVTEAKLPFWMKDTRFDKDVQKLKKGQGGAEAGEYIVPNKGFSSKFIKKKSSPIKGLPSHIQDVSKGTIPFSDESSFFIHTDAGKYVMDQQKGARSHFNKE